MNALPLQEAEKAAINQEAALLAFDRQNHMGASEALTSRLRETIRCGGMGCEWIAARWRAGVGDLVGGCVQQQLEAERLSGWRPCAAEPHCRRCVCAWHFHCSEEAEALLADKRVASGAVNIKDNEERMKVG